jgi:hypothetical protein
VSHEREPGAAWPARGRRALRRAFWRVFWRVFWRRYGSQSIAGVCAGIPCAAS